MGCWRPGEASRLAAGVREKRGAGAAWTTPPNCSFPTIAKVGDMIVGQTPVPRGAVAHDNKITSRLVAGGADGGTARIAGRECAANACTMRRCFNSAYHCGQKPAGNTPGAARHDRGQKPAGKRWVPNVKTRASLAVWSSRWRSSFPARSPWCGLPATRHSHAHHADQDRRTNDS
jgi:hypothetical protein